MSKCIAERCFKCTSDTHRGLHERGFIDITSGVIPDPAVYVRAELQPGRDSEPGQTPKTGMCPSYILFPVSLLK